MGSADARYKLEWGICHKDKNQLLKKLLCAHSPWVHSATYFMDSSEHCVGELSPCALSHLFYSAAGPLMLQGLVSQLTFATFRHFHLQFIIRVKLPALQDVNISVEAQPTH